MALLLHEAAGRSPAVTFGTFFERATGFEPYPYQTRLGEDGLPDLIEVPTGLGKSAGVVTAWLYRRRFHPDSTVRAATPSRLVVCLPMRVLVEQTADVVPRILGNVGVTDDVTVRVLMGGEPMRGPNDWRLDIGGDSIVIGTIDMVLSRCLNRGYGQNRYFWPVDFGLLNADSHFVFDEIQLMGPALATSRQLHGLRAAIGAALPTSSTWMSATVDRSTLVTVDAPELGTEVGLRDDDLASPDVLDKYRAPKLLTELAIDDPKRAPTEIAAAAVEAHRPGTLTLVVLNTVDRATEVHRRVAGAADLDAEVVLLHSRFRPRDRAARVGEAVAPVDAAGPGRIVVSTQVVEAGVDISANTMITDVAPWPSIVQRAGRCNRDGKAADPTMMWVRVPERSSAPYEAADLAASAEALASLDDSEVDSERLLAQSVEVVQPIVATLRRRDLLELFDTLPDLSGNDVDVSRFIRDADDLDVALAWRTGLGDGLDGQPMPSRNERCSIPVKAFRDWLRALRRKVHRPAVWRWNIVDRRWEHATESDVRPGAVFLADAGLGGYAPDIGWSPKQTAAVEPVTDDEPAPDDMSTDDDPLSEGAAWVTLSDHLADAEREAGQIVDGLAHALPAAHAHAIRVAARLHDIGKAHPQFQTATHAIALKAGVAIPADALLAKTALKGRLNYERRGFRHELASALCLMGEGSVALDGVDEPDLVVYLVAAHHGKVRVGVRAVPGEAGTDRMLGVQLGDTMPPIEVPGGEIPLTRLDVESLALGADGADRSFTDRVLELRDRDDIGVFRLGFLEAVVRLADWRASADPTPYVPEADHG